LKRIGSELKVRYFSLQEIPSAVMWAEQGNIAIHENYLSRKRQSYHVISGERDHLVLFCQKVGLSERIISASEFFHFWHLTWFPSGGDHLIDSTSVAISAVRSSPHLAEIKGSGQAKTSH